MTTRQEKIKALEAIRDGAPAKFVLREIKFLYRNAGETVWRTTDQPDSEVLPEAERLEYFPKAICCENVSLQFAYKWDR